MADDGKDGEVEKGQSRRGFKRYGSNPSVPENGLQEVKRRPVVIPFATVAPSSQAKEPLPDSGDLGAVSSCGSQVGLRIVFGF